MVMYGSVCSGIEAASMAWESLGMRPAWFSEIEPFPCSVLAHHWPNVPNIGDMTTLPTLIRTGIAPAPEVLVGGTPCQAFSVAGMRRGLDDDRGQLTMTYVEVLNAIDERRGEGDEAVCVWENVPGVLSSKDNAFGCFLAALCGEDEELKPPGKRWANAGCVFGPQRAIAWRVLDAQYFGVAQRRRRVFLVASARAGFDPTAVLFEREGVRRDTPPSREAGQEATTPTARGFTPSSFGAYREELGTLRAAGGDFCGGSEQLVGSWWDGGQVSQTLDAVLHKGQTLPEKGRFPAVLQVRTVVGDIAHTLNTANSGKGCSEDGTGRGVPTVAYGLLGDETPKVGENVSPTLRAEQGGEGRCVAAPPVAFHHNAQACQLPGPNRDTAMSDSLTCSQGAAIAIPDLAVRRLTPVECERLQGFPDGHTDVPHRGKPAADGPRYKAIGNSKAVPVVNWLGKRLLKCLINC